MGTGSWVLDPEPTRSGWFWVHINGCGPGSGFTSLDASGSESGNGFWTKLNS